MIGFPKRGPSTQISDERLLELIREVIEESPLLRVRAIARSPPIYGATRRSTSAASGSCASCEPMACWLLNATRSAVRPDPTTAPSSPRAPIDLWERATMAWTRNNGWVWAFCCVDHFTAEAWTSVAKRGDRFACLEPIYGAPTASAAPTPTSPAASRHDWGPQYTRATSKGPSPGSGSRTALRSPTSRRATAAPSALSGRSRNNACGHASTKTSRTSARPCLSSPVDTTSISSSDTDTAHRARGRDREQGSMMVKVRKLSKEPGPVQQLLRSMLDYTCRPGTVQTPQGIS